MYNASDYVVGTILNQWKDKITQVIHYASKTLTKVQLNNPTQEKSFW